MTYGEVIFDKNNVSIVKIVDEKTNDSEFYVIKSDNEHNIIYCNRTMLIDSAYGIAKKCLA